jgi:hypothetical protein
MEEKKNKNNKHIRMNNNNKREVIISRVNENDKNFSNERS